ncbi:beta-N-acetylhexosaminidase [Pseudarthrobacter sp. J75]|uniref:beta-N-acetylhexosaminidase n=1 Tax=unclassified Pseudarthrobacter TaxID=2647000 RepID=UPI002E8224B9|nr:MULTISPECIES: beta-N-acetylhexosaminidase [unclassified Pseudarthrobacter]MEE2523164.1 beta-N-acetylhexosaminidase [Pseudarthrobacter sp. J47]MEE2527419.1 beta-N-acetylhexosaminidase [Pseudarthrobacter sp. J75]
MDFPLPLIPLPARLDRLDGEDFVLSSASFVAAGPECRTAAEELTLILRRSTGFELPILDGEESDGGITLVINPDLTLGAGVEPAPGPEAYSLTVDRTGAVITGASTAGLFNGVQTLRQLLPAAVENSSPVDAQWRVPAVVIRDSPRFAYRGLMLDVARSFLDVAEVKRQIDTMVQFKFNVLHLHLTDDQAWRIEIHNPEDNPSGLDYGALTALGGTGAVDFPGVGLSPGLTGFYTQAEFTDIVDYAARRNVLVVPEIDMPGHVNAALAAIPQLTAGGTTPAMNTTGEVGFSSLEAGNPVTYEFAREVIRQLAALTPGPYLHIGGDEALVTPREEYLSMVSEIASLVVAAGKVPVGWNEYAAARIPHGSVIQYWHGSTAATLERTSDARAAIIMSPAERTYLDQKYDPASPIGLSWVEGGPFSWREYYDWDPAGLGIPGGSVLGIEGPLWSETVRGGRQADWLLYPRAMALAEVAWSPQEQRHAPDLAARLGLMGARLALQGVAFQAAPDIDWSAEPASPFDF